MTQTLETTSPVVTAEQIQSYRARGFTRVRGLISQDEVAEFREAVLRVSQTAKKHSGESKIFTQVVNAWLLDETIKRLTFHPNVGRILMAQGIPADRIYEVAGRADSEPLFADDPTLPGNRRIAITLLREAPPLPAEHDL